MMKRTLQALAIIFGVLLVATALMIFLPLPQAPDLGVTRDIVIKDVNIVDVEADNILTHQDVTVRSGRIDRIEPTSEAVPAQSFLVVDGRGKYLLPGLWDMHTHSYKTSPQFHHPLYIANGVTGVRDMSGCMSEPDNFWACIEDRKRWNQNIAENRGISPRYILQSSFQMNGGSEVPSGFPDFFKANNLDKTQELVAFYADAGADFLKTYSDLSPAAYRQLAKEAQERGLALAGHRPMRISLNEAISAGQQTIEHPRLFLFECFKGAEAFRRLANPTAAYNTALKLQLVDDHDAKRCVSLMQDMAASDTFWTPTLQVLQMSAHARDSAFRNDPRLKYIPYILDIGMWQGDADRSARRLIDENGRNVDAEIYALAQRNLSQAYKAGVKILAGTDAGDSYVFPGFSVHQELALYVEAGIPPEHTLKIATIEAARFSKLDTDFGSIKVGKVADMLLLGADPYADINNTQKIEGLFFDRRYFDRSALDELLLFAEQQASSIPFNLRFLWDVLSSPLMRVQLAD